MTRGSESAPDPLMKMRTGLPATPRTSSLRTAPHTSKQHTPVLNASLVVLTAPIAFSIILTLLILSNLVILAPVARAWKVKTHAYSANLLMQEIEANGGMVEIPPYGKFSVLPQYLQAIRKYPAQFRSGSVGPDLMPDLYTAQVYYHPKKSYEYLEYYWQKAKTMPMIDINALGLGNIPGIADAMLPLYDPIAAQAYVLGFSVHAAGDYFGHSWVNKWAGGPWPELADGISTADEHNIMRHNAIEGFVDERIPIIYQMPQMNSLSFPIPFIRNVMMDDSFPYTRFSGSEPQHLALFKGLRRLVASHTGDIWPIGSYARNWVQDIDEGLNAWLDISGRLAQTAVQPKFMPPFNPGVVATAEAEYSTWVNDHLYSMLGAPDFFGVLAGFIAGIMDALPQPLKDIKQGIRDFFLSKGLEAIYGSTLDEIKALGENPGAIIDNPAYFSVGSRASITADMRNFATALTGLGQEFAPFSNTLTLAKLNLIGYQGLLELRRRAADTSALPTWVPMGDMLLECVSSFDVGYSFDNPGMFPQALSTTEGGKGIARQIFNFNGTAPKPSIADVPTEAVEQRTTGTVPVWATFSKAPRGASMGIFPADPGSTRAIASESLYDQPNGNFSVEIPQGTPPGDYQLRILDAAGNVLAGSVHFRIGKVVPPPAPPPPSFKTMPQGPVQLPSEAEGSRYCSATYANPPKAGNGVMGLFTAEGTPVCWDYADTAPLAVYSAKIPWGTREGKYSFRMYDTSGRLLVQGPELEFRFSLSSGKPGFTGSPDSKVALANTEKALTVGYTGTAGGARVALYPWKDAPAPAPLPWAKAQQSSPRPGTQGTVAKIQGSVKPSALNNSALADIIAGGVDPADLQAILGVSSHPVADSGPLTSSSGVAVIKVPGSVEPGRYAFRLYDAQGVLLSVGAPFELTAPPDPPPAPKPLGSGEVSANMKLLGAKYTLDRIRIPRGAPAPDMGYVGLTVDFSLISGDGWTTIDADSLHLTLPPAQEGEEPIYPAAVWIPSSSEPLQKAVLATGSSLALRALFWVPEGYGQRILRASLNPPLPEAVQATFDLVREGGLATSVSVKRPTLALGEFRPMGDLDIAVADLSSGLRLMPGGKGSEVNGSLTLALRNPGTNPVPLDMGSFALELWNGAEQADLELGYFTEGQGLELPTQPYLLPGGQARVRISLKAEGVSVNSVLRLSWGNAQPLEFSIKGLSGKVSPGVKEEPPSKVGTAVAGKAWASVMGPGGGELRVSTQSLSLTEGYVAEGPWRGAPAMGEIRLVLGLRVLSSGVPGAPAEDFATTDLVVHVLDDLGIVRPAEAVWATGVEGDVEGGSSLAAGEMLGIKAYFTLPVAAKPVMAYVGGRSDTVPQPIRIVTAKAKMNYPEAEGAAKPEGKPEGKPQLGTHPIQVPAIVGIGKVIEKPGGLPKVPRDEDMAMGDLRFSLVSFDRSSKGVARCRLQVTGVDGKALEAPDQAPVAVLFATGTGIALPGYDEEVLSEGLKLRVASGVKGFNRSFAAEVPRGYAVQGAYVYRNDDVTTRGWELGEAGK